MSPKSLYLGILCILAFNSTINAQVVADFSSDKQDGCAPVTIQYKNLSTGGSMTYLWSFGNGNISTLKNPQAIYYLPGTYKVSLRVVDSVGNKSIRTIDTFIRVYKNPVADFKVNKSSGCAPHEVQYQDLSKRGDGQLLSWQWDFGDGNTSKDSQASHSFKVAGFYTNSLLVTDVHGCQDKFIVQDYIEVKPSAEIEIQADQRYSCTAPFTVYFKDKSKKVSSGDLYTWHFGDGDSSNQVNPVHTYTKKGNYTVSLKIKKVNGCVSSKTYAKYIVVDNLQANFEADKTLACSPSTIFFTNTSSPQIPGVSFIWDFGDGTQSFGVNPQHTYTNPGVYTVSLTALGGSCSKKETALNYIKIDPSPVPDFTLSDSISCKVPLNIFCYDQSTNASKIEWTLLEGNVNLGNTQSTVAVIKDYGTYHIRLKASNSAGCAQTMVKTIEVQPIKAIFDIDNITGCAPQRAYFTDLTESWDSIVKRTWKFEKASVNGGDTISRYYPDSGVYKITMFLETSSGCKASVDSSVEYGIKLDPYFSEPFDTFCNMENIYFYNLAGLFGDSVKVDSVLWSLAENGGDYSGFSTSYHGSLTTDLDSGYYSLKLEMEHLGCWNAYSVDSQFYIDPPNAKNIFVDVDTCNLQSITVKNRSQGADSFVWVMERYDTLYYSWDSIIKFEKEDHGTRVELRAYNFRSGCKDVKTNSIRFPGQRTVADYFVSGNLCAPSELAFAAVEYDSINYYWYTPSDTLLGEKQKISFEKPGEYTVVLEVKNKYNGCTDRDTFSATVTGPEVSGLVIGTEGCSPVDIILRSESDPDDYVNLYWLVDDLKIDVEEAGDIAHQLVKPGDKDGLYSISLIGTDPSGCQGREDFEFNVIGVVNSFIKIRRFARCQADQYIFQLEAPNFDINELDLEWDFGDGTTAEGNTITKIYSGQGVYEVTLKVTQPNGCITILSELIDIEKEKLYADFNADSLHTDCPPLFIQFQDRSLAKNRRITSWEWDFGDGSGSVEKNPSKLYLKSGVFTVKLYIEDEWGCKDTVIAPDLILVNGPQGSYDFDKDHGCVPLEVNFDSDTLHTHVMEWDMGDGKVIKYEDALTYVYTQPGRYIPLLILSDTFGCSYTLPPIDTIYVDAYPQPQIGPDNFCFDAAVEMTVTDETNTELETYLWTFEQNGNRDSSSDANPVYTFSKEAIPIVHLEVVSVAGCKSSVSDTLDLKQIHADFIADQEKLCVDDLIKLRSNASSDTDIEVSLWIVHGDTFYGTDLNILPDSIGPIKIFHYVRNISGCSDSLVHSRISAGDTVPPPAINFHYVSVLNDTEVELEFESSGILDFKNYLIYKDGSNTAMMSVDDQGQTHVFDGANDTRNTSYCYKVSVENTCGLESEFSFSDPHCTVECGASSAINSTMVRWHAYTGWDPEITHYVLYKEDWNNPGDYFQIYQTNPGDSLSPYTDSAVRCNIEHRYRIEAYKSGVLYTSRSDTCAAKPIWENQLKPNEVIRASVVDDKEIVIEWNATPEPQVEISRYVLERSLDGLAYYKIAELPSGQFEKYDLDVLVDDYSYFYRSYSIDACGDTSPVSNIAKTILLKADTTIEQRPILNWSTYKGWEIGVNYYSIEIKNPDGSFTQIGSTSYNDTSLIDWVTLLNQRPTYCYRIIGHRNTLGGETEVVSISNEDCSPVRSYIWFPNAFSPNGDGLNDLYVTPSIYVVEYHIMIFNRWGEKVFESFDYYNRWDGSYQGEPCQQDVYMVIVEATGVDRIRTIHKATVTLLR